MTAQDRDTSLAVMSAVMSEFSHQLLEKEDHDKLIFIVDETPFFIQHSFETFKLLSKNVRKLEKDKNLEENMESIFKNK